MGILVATFWITRYLATIFLFSHITTDPVKYELYAHDTTYTSFYLKVDETTFKTALLEDYWSIYGPRIEAIKTYLEENYDVTLDFTNSTNTTPIKFERQSGIDADAMTGRLSYIDYYQDGNPYIILNHAITTPRGSSAYTKVKSYTVDLQIVPLSKKSINQQSITNSRNNVIFDFTSEEPQPRINIDSKKLVNMNSHERKIALSQIELKAKQ